VRRPGTDRHSGDGEPESVTTAGHLQAARTEWRSVLDGGGVSCALSGTGSRRDVRPSIATWPARPFRSSGPCRTGRSPPCHHGLRQSRQPGSAQTMAGCGAAGIQPGQAPERALMPNSLSIVQCIVWMTARSAATMSWPPFDSVEFIAWATPVLPSGRRRAGDRHAHLCVSPDPFASPAGFCLPPAASVARITERWSETA